MKKLLNSTKERRVQVERRKNNNIILKVFVQESFRHNLTVSVCRLSFVEFVAIQRADTSIYNGKIVTTVKPTTDNQIVIEKFGNSPTWQLQDSVIVTEDEFEQLCSLDIIPTTLHMS